MHAVERAAVTDNVVKLILNYGVLQPRAAGVPGSEVERKEFIHPAKP